MRYFARGHVDSVKFREEVRRFCIFFPPSTFMHRRIVLVTPHGLLRAPSCHGASIHPRLA